MLLQNYFLFSAIYHVLFHATQPIVGKNRFLVESCRKELISYGKIGRYFLLDSSLCRVKWLKLRLKSVNLEEIHDVINIIFYKFVESARDRLTDCLTY